MPVRDIVKRFEIVEQEASSSRIPTPVRRQSTPQTPGGGSNGPLTPMPTPSPARFVHPLLKPSAKTTDRITRKDLPQSGPKDVDTDTPNAKPKIVSPLLYTKENRRNELVAISGVTSTAEAGAKQHSDTAALGGDFAMQTPTIQFVPNISPIGRKDFVMHDGLPLQPLKQTSLPSPLPRTELGVTPFTLDWRGQASRKIKQDTRDEGTPPPAYSISTIIASSAQTCLPQSSVINDIKTDPFSRHTYDTNDTNDPLIPHSSVSSTVIHKKSSHVPVAAKTVFSRGSAPLLLPALDEYLSSFPAPKFSSFQSRNPPPKGKQKHTDAVPFPPMELLTATGRTIEELEKNSTVPYWFQDRASIFNSLTNWFLGTLGSSALVSYYSLNGLYDSLQIFALLLSTFINHNDDVVHKWRDLLLGTIPNILALNFARTSVSLIMFIILVWVSGLLIYIFRRSVAQMYAAKLREGFQGKDKSSHWAVVFTAFILTVVYLPMSTMAVHALIWSDDFWPTSASTTPTTPRDVCYTTTLNENEINFAPAIIGLSLLTFVFLTIGFPVLLVATIRNAVPRVDKYTELGMLRNRFEINHEYQRLLDRDKNALAFLYKDLRWGWASYKPAYLLVKLSTLLIVAVLDTNNCLFLGADNYTISMIRQALLVVAMTAFLIIHSILTPFLDPVNNASEWVSRAGYVAFAVLGLIGSLHIPSKVQDAFNGPVLYIVYFINYTFTYYFAFINLSWTHRLVKRIFQRVDFSIDIFSPDLDISSNSRHIRRRIWQETISVLLLATPECVMSKKQQLNFAEAENGEWPPYLLDFHGTPAERHVENLKILRELGGMEYARGVAVSIAKCCERLTGLQNKIERYFVGPDSYWQQLPARPNESNFGNAWWIPFPPTLVMKYDSGKVVVLNKLHELEAFVGQNEDRWVREKKQIRMALRALDGKVVRWPYTHTEWIGSKFPWCWGHRYTAQMSVKYESCVLSIKRKGSLPWKGFELGSGFDIELTYSPDLKVDGTVLGVDDAYDLTPQLALFFRLNHSLLHKHLPYIDFAIDDYRRGMRKIAREKRNVLTYQFLSNVYCSPKEMHELTEILIHQEKNLQVRQMFVEYQDAVNAANERMFFVLQSEASTWWYLYWDDLWRRNHDVISALETYASDFDPHYPTSIAYRLLPRPALESFLTQRGLFKTGGKNGFIYSGILNKLYFRLNQIVFRGSSKVIQYHIGEASFEVDLEGLDSFGHTKASTLGTGGGTDHDDAEIRARPMYRWEDILDDPVSNERSRRWLPKLAVWLGLSPYWHSRKARTSGISLDLRLEDGSYVMLDQEVEKLKEIVS